MHIRYKIAILKYDNTGDEKEKEQRWPSPSQYIMWHRRIVANELFATHCNEHNSASKQKLKIKHFNEFSSDVQQMDNNNTSPIKRQFI